MKAILRLSGSRKDARLQVFLAATDPNITFAGKVAFGDTAGVEQGAEDVEGSLEDQPTQRRVRHGVHPALGHRVVHGRDGSAQTETDEHT